MGEYEWALCIVQYNGRLAAHKDVLKEQCIVISFDLCLTTVD